MSSSKQTCPSFLAFPLCLLVCFTLWVVTVKGPIYCRVNDSTLCHGDTALLISLEGTSLLPQFPPFQVWFPPKGSTSFLSGILVRSCYELGLTQVSCAGFEPPWLLQSDNNLLWSLERVRSVNFLSLSHFE